MVELGKQRQGRVDIEREKTIQYGALLVGMDELGSGTGYEIGELKEEPARPPWGVKYGRCYSRSRQSILGVCS